MFPDSDPDTQVYDEPGWNLPCKTPKPRKRKPKTQAVPKATPVIAADPSRDSRDS